MRTIRSTVLALMLSAAPAAMLAVPAQAQVTVDIRVAVAPPPLPYYEQPPIPADGYLWVPGYWAWDQSEDDYYWVPGTWVEPPQRELLWTPAYWGFEDGRYGFHPGYWGREVGFYGGIDYGYGYGGEGYLGGRWNNGAFFYNRTVNNVENVRITNVYNETVVVNNRTNVSFNGGNGGTTVRPTPREETFARQQHVEATPVQRQQMETASKDRALFSKQNHGEPAVAATPRAGVFQGAGVVRGSRKPVAATPGAPPPPNGTEKPGAMPKVAPSKEIPKEIPKAVAKPGETPRQAEPPRTDEMNKQAPKSKERGKPMQAPPKVEERKPVQETPKAEERRPAQEPSKAASPKAEPPRGEEPRRQAPEAPRAAEPRPAQEARPPQEGRPPQAMQARPPAAQAPRPQPGSKPGGQEEKKRE
ncbi:MAG: hypothetical protein ABI196_15755 [Bradyrhizobium sp.]